MIVLWAFTAGSLLTLDRYDVVAFAVSFLLLLVLATSILFDQVALPQEEPVRHGLWTKVSGYFLTTFILMVTAITFPFFRQGSNYERLPSGGGQ
jgi:hypothetical protein